MALHNLLATVTIPFDTGLPTDVAVNTFAFLWDDSVVGVTTDALMGAQLGGRLTDFYQANESAFSINCMSPMRGAIYDRGDAPPRVPLYEWTIDYAPGASASYPNEVAVCLSFQGASLSGVEQASRRGRIYFGPLQVTVGQDYVGDVGPSDTFAGALAAAAEVLLAANSPGLKWGVWSPTLAQFTEITNGWVDNAFDTVRSRGKRATSRILWP